MTGYDIGYFLGFYGPIIIGVIVVIYVIYRITKRKK
jgi:hypothetical protein